MGTVKAGVVGLTNSGKSTFLNAILGKQYLPSSIQSQTARQVVITHSPKSNGELYTTKEASDPEHMAHGWQAVNAKLLDVNMEARLGNVTFQKLSLSAPIIFLEGVDRVQLEISDTPGLYEAVAGNISFESELAVKEMSAFILILNLRVLKTESEANIIRSLMNHHPEIFSKLSRILILVNAYDIAFYDDSPAGLHHKNISLYVADYLRDPNIIGLNISAEQIIPFSAMWALNARMWSSDPAAFLRKENAKLLYDEAVILMKRASEEEVDLKPFDQVTAKDIEEMCAFLLEFSHIKRVEESLKAMLYNNGPAILLEATVDDSVAQVSTILSLFDTKIKSEKLEEKRAFSVCHGKLQEKFNEIEGTQVFKQAKLSSPTAEINSIGETLRGTLNAKVNSIFQNHLVGFHVHKDRNAVFNRICSVKPLLSNPANTEMQASWNSASRIVHQKGIEHARSAISNTKTDFVTALTSFAQDNPICGELGKYLSNKLSNEIDRINSDALMPALPGLSTNIDGHNIPNSQLDRIKTSYETEWKSVKHSKRKATGLFNAFRKKKTYYVSESYQGVRYSPDLNAIQNVLSSEATAKWILAFRNAADGHIATFTTQLHTAIVNSKTSALKSTKAELTQAFGKSRQAVAVSSDTVNRLTTHKNNLVKIRDELKERVFK